MRKLLLFSLLFGSLVVARDNGNSTEDTYKRAFDIHKDIHKDCNSSNIWGIFTNPWTPTLIFATAVLKETCTNYKSHALPSFFDVKETIKDKPIFLAASGAFLASCILYKYYKPLIVSAYDYWKGYFGEKKIS